MLKKVIGILSLLIVFGCTVSYIVVKKSGDVDIEVKESTSPDIDNDTGIKIKRDSTRNNFN